MTTRSSIKAIIALAGIASAKGPCDIYAAGNTPCVAAHSTTRALYASYKGPLYQVTRNSDGATTDIVPLSAGDVANATAQDVFCSTSTCSISTIYDQSGRANHLTRAHGGQFNGPQSDGSDNLANPVGAPVTVNGKKAYGVFVSPGTGYRNDQTSGVATGDNPQGIYAIVDGTHYNDNCCFDYGNGETSNSNTGSGHMEAIYFGNCAVWDTGAGPGPWIMGDLENGLFSSNIEFGQSASDPTQTSRFLTAVVKGEPNQWSIRGANASGSSLATYYSGARPSGYATMHKEGAIILGIGGDNSNGAQGTFYEGAMTASYPSDDTENQVQANIASMRYAAGALNSGKALTVGSAISFGVTTPGYTSRSIAHNGSSVITQVVSSSDSTATKQAASWYVRTGLAQPSCFSFESVDTPGSFIRHYGFQLQLSSNDGTKQMHEDATFCTQSPLNGQGDSIRSWSYPARYFRHYANVLYVASQGGPESFDATSSYANDVSFLINNAFAT